MGQFIIELIKQTPQIIQALIDCLGAISLVCTPLSIVLALFGATTAATRVAKFGKDIIWLVVKLRTFVLSKLPSKAIINGSLCLLVSLVLGCASAKASTTSAQTANGKSWPLCVQVDFQTMIPLVRDWSLLACASTEATLADAKQSAVDSFKVEHPDAKLVAETRLPLVSLEQFKATHPNSKVVVQ